VAAVREAEVRAAELVRRAEEDVDPERLDVDRLVRGEVDGVDPAEGAGGVGELRHARDVRDRPDRVRGGDAGDDANALVELSLEVAEVQPQIVADVDPVDVEAAIRRELDPGRDAAVVVEARDEDPVALAPVARRRPREREVERRHVRSEDHVLRRAVEEAPRVGARPLEDGLDAAARLVRCPEVAARLAERARDRIADLVRHLRAAR
jgi:hypothetical protein